MQTNPEFIRQSVEEKLAFVRRCGLKLIACRPGYVECLMPAEGNENHLGTMYAGALFTLAEIPGGALWLSSFDITRSYPILKSFRIDYLKPAKGDIRFSLDVPPERIATLDSECSQYGKVEFELRGDLRDKAGTVVAQSVGLYQLRRR